MSITISFHDLTRDEYDVLDTLELHGPNHVWKTFYVGETKLVFFPGEWRQLPFIESEESAYGAGS